MLYLLNDNSMLIIVNKGYTSLKLRVEVSLLCIFFWQFSCANTFDSDIPYLKNYYMLIEFPVSSVCKKSFSKREIMMDRFKVVQLRQTEGKRCMMCFGSNVNSHCHELQLKSCEERKREKARVTESWPLSTYCADIIAFSERKIRIGIICVRHKGKLEFCFGQVEGLRCLLRHASVRYQNRNLN